MVVWEDHITGTETLRSIRAQRFDALGNKVGTEIVVNPAIEGVAQSAPNVTGLANGGFFVTWNFERPPVGEESNDDVTGKIFNANGAFVDFLEPVPFSLSQPDTKDQTNGAVARLGDGLASVAVFTEAFSPTDDDIVARVFAENGASVRIEVATAPGNQSEPDVAVSRDAEHFAVVWTDTSNDASGNIMGRIFEADGDQEVASFQVNAVSSGSQSRSTVTWLDEHVFVVAWTDLFEIFARVFALKANNTVTPLTGDIQVNASTPGQQVDPDIVALPGGGFVIAWDDNRLSGNSLIRLQAFDGLGGKVGQETIVNTTSSNSTGPQLTALADGRVAVTWTDQESSSDHNVRMQIFDPRDGIVYGSELSETLYGHDLVNDEITGFGGDDLLIGLKGDDALYGGGGTDRLRGGFGADHHEGGTGVDVAEYTDSTAAAGRHHRRSARSP